MVSSILLFVMRVPLFQFVPSWRQLKRISIISMDTIKQLVRRQVYHSPRLKALDEAAGDADKARDTSQLFGCSS